jgi:hypothetical protein
MPQKNISYGEIEATFRRTSDRAYDSHSSMRAATGKGRSNPSELSHFPGDDKMLVHIGLRRWLRLARYTRGRAEIAEQPL